MKDEDLEKTRPIETLVDFEVSQSRVSRTQKEGPSSRSVKYKDALEEDSEAELEELAEEALAEKNINMAETLLDEEKKEKEDKESEENNDGEESKKDDKGKKKLTEKQKTIIMVVAGILVLVVLVIVMILIFKKPKEDKKTTATPQNNPTITEEPPEIVDNFYYRDGKLHLLSGGETEIGTYECNNKEESLCYVAYNNYRDEFDADILKDEKGNITKQRLKIYNADYVFINDTSNTAVNNIVLYSLSAGTAISTYSDVKAFDENYVIVKDGTNKYGLIQVNEEIKEIIKPQYEYLGMINGQDNLVAKNNSGYVVISRQNKVLSAPLNGSNTIKNYNDKLIVTMQDKKYNVFNYEGKLVAGDYTFATIDDEYIGLVRSKRLYVRDIDGNKLNEEGIPLKNITYVREYIYDDQKQLKETKRSFSLATKDKHVEVIVFNADVNDEPAYTNLNPVLGKINAKYKRINYLNDKLYIYSDEEKEKLLGSYACNSKNAIVDEESVLDACLIAKDTVYEQGEINSESRDNTIPIINNKFVFIKDGEETVYLYNLVDSKVMGTYKSVNTYTGNNGNDLKTFTGMTNVIALNKKDKYGMINIDGGNAISVYSFDYDYMEKLGTFVMAREGNSWLLLNGTNAKEAKFPGRIVNHDSSKKFFKVSKDKKYGVYDEDVKQIGDTYKDVILYSGFYLGINDSNEIFLYDYKGEKITSRAVKAGSTCTSNKPYYVEFNNNKYTIYTCNGDKYEKNIYDPAKKKFEGDEQSSSDPGDGQNSSTDDKKNDDKETDDKTSDDKKTS